MKKCLLILSLAYFCFLSNTHAQISKGSTLIDFSFGGHSNKTDYNGSTDTSRMLSSRLRFGKAIRENLIVGLTGSYMGQSNKGTIATDNKLREYGIGVFARQYRKLGKSDFYLFAHGELAASFWKRSYGFPNQTAKDNGSGYMLSLAPGLSYAVNNWLHLQTGFNNLFAVSYNRSEQTNSQGSKTTSRGFSAGVNSNVNSDLYIGFTILINKKAKASS